MGRLVNDGCIPPDVEPAFGLVTSEEGRAKLGVEVPTYLRDTALRTHGDMAREIADAAITLGVDPITAEEIGLVAVTHVGLKYFQNTIDAGYAARVLEERAGLEPLPTAGQVAERELRQTDEHFLRAVAAETELYAARIAAENAHYEI